MTFFISQKCHKFPTKYRFPSVHRGVIMTFLFFAHKKDDVIKHRLLFCIIVFE